jgi:hypothetical protein
LQSLFNQNPDTSGMQNQKGSFFKRNGIRIVLLVVALSLILVLAELYVNSIIDRATYFSSGFAVVLVIAIIGVFLERRENRRKKSLSKNGLSVSDAT